MAAHRKLFLIEILASFIGAIYFAYDEQSKIYKFNYWNLLKNLINFALFLNLILNFSSYYSLRNVQGLIVIINTATTYLFLALITIEVIDKFLSRNRIANNLNEIIKIEALTSNATTESWIQSAKVLFLAIFIIISYFSTLFVAYKWERLRIMVYDVPYYILVYHISISAYYSFSFISLAEDQFLNLIQSISLKPRSFIEIFSHFDELILRTKGLLDQFSISLLIYIFTFFLYFLTLSYQLLSRLIFGSNEIPVIHVFIALTNLVLLTVLFYCAKIGNVFNQVK